MPIGSVTGSTSRAQSTAQNLRRSARRIVVMGPPGSGKSTLSASASTLVGETLPLVKPLVATDVAVIQGDAEGMAGAKSVGIDIARIYDMTACKDYTAYKAQLVSDIRELIPLVKAGTVKVVIVDLALPNSLLQTEKLADLPGAKMQQGWGAVRFEGMELYKLFSPLLGATIVANCQIKTAESPNESEQAAAASTARATGGARNTYTADICKGVGSVWIDNASLVLSVDRTMVRDEKTREKRPETRIYTQSNGKFEAKSRFGNTLAPVESGTRTLHSLLKQCYGDAL